MRTIYRAFLGLVIAGLLLPACDQLSGENNKKAEKKETAKEKEPSKAEIKKMIQSREDILSKAYNTKDLELFSSFYGEDAVTYGPGREQLYGKQAILHHFEDNVMVDSLDLTFEYHTIDVFAEGDMALETGKWVQKDTAGKEIDHGYYMSLFKKEDGVYKSIRDMWNSAEHE